MAVGVYRLSKLATSDIFEILETTGQLFGPQQQERYYELFLRAAELIADNPSCLGSRDRSDLSPGMRSIHMDIPAKRRGAAAHILFYRPMKPGTAEAGVLIARVLHEHMDHERHLMSDLS